MESSLNLAVSKVTGENQKSNTKHSIQFICSTDTMANRPPQSETINVSDEDMDKTYFVMKECKRQQRLDEARKAKERLEATKMSLSCKSSKGKRFNEMLADQHLCSVWVDCKWLYVCAKSRKFIKSGEVEKYRQICRSIYINSPGACDKFHFLLDKLGTTFGRVDIRNAQNQHLPSSVSWNNGYRIFHNSGEQFNNFTKKTETVTVQPVMMSQLQGAPYYRRGVKYMLPNPTRDAFRMEDHDDSDLVFVKAHKLTHEGLSPEGSPPHYCDICGEEDVVLFGLAGTLIPEYKMVYLHVGICDECFHKELRTDEFYFSERFIEERSVMYSQGLHDYMQSIKEWVYSAAINVSNLPTQVLNLINSAKSIAEAGKILETVEAKFKDNLWIMEVFYLIAVSSWQVYTYGWAAGAPTIAYTVYTVSKNIPCVSQFFSSWISHFIEIMTAKVPVSQSNSLLENAGLLSALAGFAALIVYMLSYREQTNALSVIDIVKKISAVGFDIVVKGGKVLSTVADIFQYYIEKAFACLGIAFPTERGNLLERMGKHTKFFETKGNCAQYWVPAYSDPALMRELDKEINELAFTYDLAMRLKIDSAKNLSHTYLTILKTRKQELDSGTTAFQIQRPVPSVLQFQGTGGVGKSTLLKKVENLILMNIAKATSEELADPLKRSNYVYGFNYMGVDGTDQFMSGYNNQFIVRWDEVAQAKDSQQKPSQHNYLIMKFVDGGIFMTPQAFGGKGKVPYVSPILTLSTNTIGTWSVDRSNWASPWPIHRRLHNNYIIERKPEWVDKSYEEYEAALQNFDTDESCPCLFIPVVYSLRMGTKNAHGVAEEHVDWTRGNPVKFTDVVISVTDRWYQEQLRYYGAKDQDLSSFKNMIDPSRMQKYDEMLGKIYNEKVRMMEVKEELTKDFKESRYNLKSQGLLSDAKLIPEKNKRPRYVPTNCILKKVKDVTPIENVLRQKDMDELPEFLRPYVMVYTNPDTKEPNFCLWDGWHPVRFDKTIMSEFMRRAFNDEGTTGDIFRNWHYEVATDHGLPSGKDEWEVGYTIWFLALHSRIYFPIYEDLMLQLIIPKDVIPLTPEQKKIAKVQCDCAKANQKFELWWLRYVKTCVTVVGLVSVAYGVFKASTWFYSTPKSLSAIKSTLLDTYEGAKGKVIDGISYLNDLKDKFINRSRKWLTSFINSSYDKARNFVSSLKTIWFSIFSWFKSKIYSDSAEPDNDKRDELISQMKDSDGGELLKVRDFIAKTGEHFIYKSQSWNSENVPRIAPKQGLVRVNIKPNEIPTVMKSQGPTMSPDPDADALQMRILKNTVVFYGEYNGQWRKMSNALFVYARTCLIPKHCWEQMKELNLITMFRVNSTSNWVGNPSELLVTEVKQEDGTPFLDLVALTWKKDLISFRSLLKHFPEEQDLAGFTRTGVSVSTITEIISPVHSIDKNGERVTAEEVTLFFKNYIADTAQAIDNERYVDSILGTVNIRKGYQYQIPTVNTDCGGALSARNPHMQRKILGIHTAGDGTKGFSVALTRKSVEAAIPPEYSHELVSQGGCPVYTRIEHTDNKEVIDESYSYKVIKVEDFDGYKEETFGTIAKFAGSCVVVGKANYPISRMNSKIIPSPISETLPWPARKLPATTEKYVNEEGERIDIMRRCFDKCHAPAVYVEPDLFDDCCDDAFRCVYSKGWNDHCRILTIDEAVFGVENDPYLGSMKINSSPGVIWKKKLKGGCNGKSQWINLQKKWISQQLRDAVQEKMDEWYEGIRRFDAFSGERKSELRPLEKVNHPRLYNAGDMVSLICTKMLFGSFISWCCKNWTDTGVTVGLNPYEHFGMLETLLNSRGSKVFAGDFKRFDGSLQQRVLDGCLNQFILWYKNSGKIDPYYIRCMYTAIHVIKFCHMVVDEYYIEMFKINPSGNYLTTHINSFCIKICLRYIWCKEMPTIDSLTLTPCLVDYNKNVFEATNGDDNVVNVSDIVCDYFNQLTVAEGFMKYFRMEYTDDSKTKEFVKYKTLPEVTFLKRSFTGRKYGTLDKNSIEEIFHWCKNGKSTLDNFHSSVDSAMCEAMLHGEEYYNYLRSNVLYSLSLTDIKGINIKTYREARIQFAIMGGRMFPVVFP